MKKIGATIGALALAFVGAMLTTDFSTMRSNGESYLPALGGGLRSLWNGCVAVFTNWWFLMPFGAIALIAITARVTFLATRPKLPQTDPLVRLGVRMDGYINAAHQDQKLRDFSSYYNTTRICHQFESFICEIEAMNFPVPFPQSKSAEAWIDLCCDYFSAVSPFLRSEQIEHAKLVAQSYADQNPPEVL